MMNEWRLSAEISRATHNWPVIITYILLGSLLGGVFAYIIPSPYQASEELYVGLDPYETVDDSYVSDYANVEFDNLDDYKHWQMSQLSLLVTFDDYLRETLTKLGEQDPYWNEVDVPGLKGMLTAYWRDAGRWRLVVENKNPEMAAQAVNTWRDVIIEKTNSSISKSRELLQIDLQMKDLTREESETNLRRTELSEVRNAMLAWKKQVLDSSDNSLPNDLDRWRLWTLAARVAGYDPGWQKLLDDFPTADSAFQAYGPWIDRFMALVDLEVQNIQNQVDSIGKERAGLQTQWENTLPEGRGLSAALLVEKPSNQPPDIIQARPTSTAALVGGLLGLLVWGFVTLVQISRRLKI
jgi:hypothetical protein